MVAEADESDGSFLFLKPNVAVVTNVENDHLDHYGSFERLKDAFRLFIGQTAAEGLVVLNADDPFLASLAPGPAQSVTYGWRNGASYRAELIGLEGFGSKSKIFEGAALLGTLALAVPGRHNVTNALAAVAVGRRLGLSFEAIAMALAGYAGVARRFQLLGEVEGRLIIDDYAHHPTEVRATLAAARQLGRRVVAVFQPHRYTRTARLYRELGSSLGEADLVVVTDIYGAGEKPLAGVSGRLVAEEIRRYGHPPVYYWPDREGLTGFVADLSRPGDVVLTIGAGDIRQVGRSLCDHWGRLPPAQA
jgi:UDP-N-acetylmuramate--alanine ligase